MLLLEVVDDGVAASDVLLLLAASPQEEERCDDEVYDSLLIWDDGTRDLELVVTVAGRLEHGCCWCWMLFLVDEHEKLVIGTANEPMKTRPPMSLIVDYSFIRMVQG